MKHITPAVEVLNAKINSQPFNRAEVARRAGMNGELLNRSLKGKRRLMADELVDLCMVLDLSLEDFAKEA